MSPPHYRVAIVGFGCGNRGITKWKSDLLKLVPHIEEYLEQIESPSQIQSAEYHDVVMEHWHDESAVIIGDLPPAGRLHFSNQTTQLLEHSET